jgi:hypothetical protein
MHCVVIDSCENGLQRAWLNLLCEQLEREGHKTFVRPTTHALHHVALQEILAEFELEHADADLVAVIEQDCWPWKRWAEPIEDAFAKNENLGAFGAHHGWRNYDVGEDTVVTGEGRPRGQMFPLEDNLAAWFTVLHLPRLRAAGVALGDLDWCADGFCVERNEHGFWTGKGGDTGCRVASQVRTAGLDVMFVPTVIWPGTGFGGLAKCSTYPGMAWNQCWLMYHHFYGRQIGKRGELSVGHHKLKAEDVTSHAIKFMDLFMQGS